MYPVVPGYDYPGHRSNIVSSGAIKYYVGFQKVMVFKPSKSLLHIALPDPKQFRLYSNLTFKFNLKINKYIVVPTVFGLSKHNLSRLIHQCFFSVFNNRLNIMTIKGLTKGLPINLPNSKDPFPICLLTITTKIHRGLTIDVSKFTPGFMLQMDFSFFNF